jgi:hypothetical protein
VREPLGVWDLHRVLMGTIVHSLCGNVHDVRLKLCQFREYIYTHMGAVVCTAFGRYLKCNV